MRKLLISIVLVAATGWLTWTSRTAGAVPARATVSSSAIAPELLYHHDANQIWNRVDRALRVRIAPDGTAHGVDALDPLLWRETRHMLTPPSHAATLTVLDEFLETHAERLVTDPVRRAIFQRDLWAVFDWVVDRYDDHGGPRRALATRLARIIRRVALTRDEIGKLPHTYGATVASARYPAGYDPAQRTQAFLPPDLLDPNGPWLAVHGDAPLPQHSYEMSRSAFGVYYAIPGGRGATIDYLKKLWDTPEPFVVDPFGSSGSELRTTIKPALDAIPPGTRIALVRAMLVVDATGVIRRTPIIESVQMRVFRTSQLPRNRMDGQDDQDFFEFVLTRAGLFASPARALRAVAPHEEAFLTFSAHGFDPFDHSAEQPIRNARPLEMCVTCHRETGLESVRSARRLFRPHTFDERNGPGGDGLHLHDQFGRYLAESFKMRRADWGYLQALWHAEPW